MADIGYGSDTGLREYAEARGITLTGNLSHLNQRGFDYVETLSFSGTKVSATQANQFPRNDVYVDGYKLDNTVIPDIGGGGSVVAMQYEAAIAIDQGNDPLAPVSPAVKSRRVGPITTVYQDNQPAASIPTAITRAGHKLLSAGGISSTQFSVTNS